MSEPEKVAEAPKTEQQSTTQLDKKVESNEETPSFVKSESNKENWKAFKEARENERKAREAAERLAAEERQRAEAYREAMEALVNKPHQQQYTPQQYQQEETEDERIQKKVDAALIKERQRFQEEQKKREEAELPNHLTKAMPDFDKVCSATNIDYLEFHYPEVAAGYKHMPNSFEKWQNIYKAINRFVPTTDIKKDQKQLTQNMNKPQSMSSPGTLEGTQAKGPIILDQARLAANWERMQKQMKGIS
jgi:exonuclease VII large subunit